MSHQVNDSISASLSNMSDHVVVPTWMQSHQVNASISASLNNMSDHVVVPTWMQSHQVNASISDSLNNMSDHLVVPPWMQGGNNSNYSGFSYTSALDNLEVQIILWILYGIIAFCCVLGNSLVMFVIIRHRKMRNITNFFLANLAVSDLCVGVFCVIPTLLNFLYPDAWKLGTVMCKLNYFVQSISSTASILILTVISMERYFAIIHPMLSKRMSRMCLLRVVLAIIWLIAILYGIPLLIHFTTRALPTGEIFCFSERTIDTNILVIINFVLLYVLPLGLMCVLYARISVVLWRTSTMSAGSSGGGTCTNTGGPAPSHRQHHNAMSSTLEVQDEQNCSLRNNHQAVSLLDTPINEHTQSLSRSDSFTCVNMIRFMCKKNTKRDVSLELDERLDRPPHVSSITQDNHGTSSGGGSFKNNGPRGRLCSGSVTNGSPDAHVCSGSVTNHGPRGRICRLLSRGHDKQGKQVVQNALMARRRVIRLLIAIIATFAVCVLPHHARLMWQTVCGINPYNPSHVLMPPVTLLIFFMNSALNPILYAFLSDNFRKSLLGICDTNRSARRKDMAVYTSRTVHTGV